MTAHTRIERSQDRLIRMDEVLTRTGLARPTIYRKIREGRFPRQVRISGNCCAWYKGDVDSWVADPMGWSADQVQPA